MKVAVHNKYFKSILLLIWRYQRQLCVLAIFQILNWKVTQMNQGYHPKFKIKDQQFFQIKFIMLYNIIPAGGAKYSNNAQSFQPSDTSFCASDISSQQTKRNICFQYVNPSLLLEWEGNSKKNAPNTNQITGSGTFRAYARSKEGNHKSKLVLSLEADKWKQGKPSGQVKFMEVFFYDQFNRKDNVVKEVRKFVGKIQNMMKQGHGLYTIQYFCSNQTKELIEIRGTWSKDMIVEATVRENGKQKKDLQFINNVQLKIGFTAFCNPLPISKQDIYSKNNQYNAGQSDQTELENAQSKQKNQVKKTKQSKLSVNSLSVPTANNAKRRGVRV